MQQREIVTLAAAGLIALGLVVHALFPRYEWRTVGDAGTVIVVYDRWSNFLQRAVYETQKLKLRVFTDLNEALATRPDAAFISNPTSLHVAVALAAARAGCHLFIEKPLSHTFEQIDELIEVVERNKLTATLAYQLRFHPLVKRMSQLIAERAIGRVVLAHFRGATRRYTSNLTRQTTRNGRMIE